MLPIALLATLVSASSSLPQSHLEARIERMALRAVEREGVPGLSVALMLDGKLVFAHGFGWADERTGLPMKPETAFPLGSLGRSVSATAVLLSVDRGALASKATLEQLFPGLVPRFQAVTLEQMLAGTSGLPGTTELFPRLAARSTEGRLDRKGFLELLGTLGPRNAPGERFESDSTAWYLLPWIVADAQKKPFQQFVLGEVLEPLGLHQTAFCDTVPGTLGHATDCREIEQGRALELWSGAEPSEACAHLCSTASDLVRWQAALFDRALLTEASTRLLTESARAQDGTPLGRNALFEVGELAGQPSWRHVGGIGGWRGALSWYGNSRLAVCVLANCASAQVGELEDAIARSVLHLPPRTVQDLALEPGESALLCGLYQLGTTHVRIVEREARLWYEGEESFRLRSQGFGRFLSANGEVLITFTLEEPRASGFEETRKGATSLARRMD